MQKTKNLNHCGRGIGEMAIIESNISVKNVWMGVQAVCISGGAGARVLCFPVCFLNFCFFRVLNPRE